MKASEALDISDKCVEPTKQQYNYIMQRIEEAASIGLTHICIVGGDYDNILEHLLKKDGYKLSASIAGTIISWN